MKTLNEIKSDFKHFRESIPDYLRTVRNVLRLDALEFSLKEIDMVEQWYTTYHKKPSEIGMTKYELDNLCIAYFGVAYLWHFGGEWELETSKFGDYGAYQIVKYGGKGYHWVARTPKNWLFFIETNQAEERIATIFENRINYFKKRPEYVLKPVRNIK
jgi:hypothetical protein